MALEDTLSLEAVRVALTRIQPYVIPTPVLSSTILSHMVSRGGLEVKLFFKCENRQNSGSFKFRGAANFIAQLSDADLEGGLVAISTGNFGFAVASAAAMVTKTRSLGTVRTTVVLPSTSASSKVEGARRSGANVVLAGSSPYERESAAMAILQREGGTLVGPMDDAKIVCGQATATLEFLDHLRECNTSLDAIVLPSATGGLLAGAIVARHGTDCAVYGCEPRVGGPGLQEALTIGHTTAPLNQNTMADGLRASTAKGNFELIRNNIEGFYTAEEHEIKQAWRLLLSHLSPAIGKVEPSSAVAFSCLLHDAQLLNALKQRGKRSVNVGIILTGGNTTDAQIQGILNG